MASAKENAAFDALWEEIRGLVSDDVSSRVPSEPCGLTASEWAQVFGCNRGTARIRVTRLIEGGSWIGVNDHRLNSVGRLIPLPAYRPVDDDKWTEILKAWKKHVSK